MKQNLVLFLTIIFFSCNKDEPTPIVISISNLTISIDENPNVGQNLGTVKGSSNFGAITFNLLSETVTGALSLNATTGVLTVKDSTLFDFEVNQTINAIVEVEITSEAISKNAEVTINLNDLQIPQSGLIAFYPFNGDAKDETGNGNDGLINSLITTEDRFELGAISAFDFSNSGAYVGLGDLNAFGGNDNQFSVSFWIKPSGSLANSTIISKISQNVHCGETQQELIIRIRDGQIAPIFYNNSSDSYRGYSGVTNLQANQWYQIILNYDGSIDTSNGEDRLEMFINGNIETLTLGESQGSFPFDIEDNTAHLGIGNRLDSNGNVCVDVPFIGKIDDIAFYSRKLQLQEVILIWEDNF